MVHFQLVFVRFHAANVGKGVRLFTNRVALQGKEPLTLLDFPPSTTYTAQRHALAGRQSACPLNLFQRPNQ